MKKHALANTEARIAELLRELETVKALRVEIDKDLFVLSQEERGQEAAVAKLTAPNLDAVSERIRTAESTNANVRKAQERAQLEQQLEEKRKAWKELDEGIKKIDASKQEQLAAAKFPVPDLSFAADGITLKGIPLEQASSAEQLRVSLAMGIALNPKLKVLLIRDGSLLDEKSLQLVADMAAEAGCQVWLERVGKADKVGVLIEDGQVAGQQLPETAPAAGDEASP